MTDLDRLGIDYRTLFLLTPSGRIERKNDIDSSPGSRFWMAGCALGNVAGVHTDVPNEVYEEITSLAATEPPFVERGVQPRHFERYITLLSADNTVVKHNLGLVYHLPNDLEYAVSVTLVDSDSDEGKCLHEEMATKGLPRGLVELGFTIRDLGTPWCMAFHEGEVVAIAFCSRFSDSGAELGLVTVPGFRGRGYGAAVTAGWARLPSLQSRVLFYSTDQTNHSSQRVIERLGLRYIGSSFQIA